MCFESTTVRIPSSIMLALTCKSHMKSALIILQLYSSGSGSVSSEPQVIHMSIAEVELDPSGLCTNSSAKKVCATGAGSAKPVVSMMIPSNGLPWQHFQQQIQQVPRSWALTTYLVCSASCRLLHHVSQLSRKSAKSDGELRVWIGCAFPVVCLCSFFRPAIRSPLTVQQMQPLFISMTFSSWSTWRTWRTSMTMTDTEATLAALQKHWNSLRVTDSWNDHVRAPQSLNSLCWEANHRFQPAVMYSDSLSPIYPICPICPAQYSCFHGRWAMFMSGLSKLILDDR